MTNDYKETLYTIDKRGRRRWVYSNLIRGSWYNKRVIVAYLLMLFYLALPWVEINGKQGVLLDFVNRKFIFLGATFWATDTLFLVFVLLTLALFLFFFSALFGRVWCGWACPETIFLEFLFRPIERVIEGNGAQRLRLDRAPWTVEKIFKKGLKHFLCAFFAWVLASTALAYFIGREPLLQMMTDWPANNFLPFTMTLILMALMAFQFGWFREQFCTVLCPYARFQSVLLDSNSLVVAYNENRGEPRTKAKEKQKTGIGGDCVDCGLCVRVCPTGIDIRNGIQLECIHCTACIDACDSIMENLGRKPGLISYSTESVLAGERTSFLRPRVVIYGLLILGVLLFFSLNLASRSLTDFQVLRGAQDVPFSVSETGKIRNHLHVRLANKNEEVNSYKFKVLDNPSINLVTPLEPFPVEAGKIETTPLFLTFPRSSLKNGRLPIVIEVEDASGVKLRQKMILLGPDE